jgi:ribosomal protein S18 acetylase RimI-like enzyme
MKVQRTDQPDVLVRRLVADDWEQARDARLAALAEAPYAFASTLAREQAFGEEVWRSRTGSVRTVAAFAGATIVGLATGVPADDFPARDVRGNDESGDDESGDDAPGDGAPGDGVLVTDQSSSTSQPDWQLVGMWVAPRYRGRGVADGLVVAVCDLARDAGASAVTLWVTEVNDRARAFYRRIGFAATGGRMLVRPEEPDHWEEELTLPLV